MDVSRQEEVIAVLWIICALLAFGFGYSGFGYAFSAKGVVDILCAIYYAIKEIKTKYD